MSDPREDRPPWMDTAVSVAWNLAVLFPSLLLSQLSFPPTNLHWLGWISWTPAFVAMALLGGRNWIPGLLLAIFLNSLLHFDWLVDYQLVSVGAPAFQAWLVFTCYLLWNTLPYALCALITHFGKLAANHFSFFLLPACFTLIPALWPSPVPTGFHLPAALQAPSLQWAEVAGGSALQFLLLFASASLAALVLTLAHLQWRKLAWLLPSSAAILALLLFIGDTRRQEVRSALQEATADRRNVISVGMVQSAQPPSHIPIEQTSYPYEYKPDDFKVYEISQILLKTYGSAMDLIVWPQMPYEIGFFDESGQRTSIENWHLKYNIPLLFATHEAEPTTPGTQLETPWQRDFAHYLEGHDFHAFTSRKHLIPFMDYIPSEDMLVFLRDLMPNIPRTRADAIHRCLRVRNRVNAGTLIGLDESFPSEARTWADEGASFLISLTDDGYYDEDSGVADVRLILAILSAVESRRTLVRVSNTGHTLEILPTGELLGLGNAPLFRRAHMLAQVPITAELRPDWLPARWQLWLLLFLLGLVLGYLGRPKPPPPPEHWLARPKPLSPIDAVKDPIVKPKLE